MWRIAAQFLYVGTVVACAAALSSCGRQASQMPLFPTTGELFVGGEPAAGARLAFRPIGDESTERWPAGYPRAVVDGAGKFAVETYEPGDGCPAGEYAVLVTWPVTVPGAENSEEAETVDRLRGRFATAETSTLKAKVETRPTQLGRYELK